MTALSLPAFRPPSESLPLAAVGRFEGLHKTEQLSPLQTIILVGIVAALVGGLFLLNWINNRKAMMKGKPGSHPSSKSSFRAFRRTAKKMGLSKEQTGLLESIIRKREIKNPFVMLNNSRTFDRALKTELEELKIAEDLDEQTREHRKLKIFKIKQLVEQRSRNKGEGLSSTKQFHIGEEITLTLPGNVRYKTAVTSKLSDFFCVDPPVDKDGNEVPVNKDLNISVTAFRGGNAMVVFPSQTLGYLKTRRYRSLRIKHSSQGKTVHNRRHRRKPVKKPVYCYPVTVITHGKGKKARREAKVLKQKRISGTLQDLSPGGCCIQSRGPMKAGSLLQMQFEPHQGDTILVLGKVVRMEDQGRYGGLMHIMFTRASSASINAINAFVYDMA